MTLVGVQARRGGSGTADTGALAVHDVIVVRGAADTVRRLADDRHLTFQTIVPDSLERGLLTADRGVAEVVIPPRSPLVGAPVFPGMSTDTRDLLVIAVRRGGTHITGQVALDAGDTLLLRGSWDALEDRVDDPDMLVVDSPRLVRRRAVPVGLRGKKAVVVLIGMVALLATGALPEAVTGLLAAGALMLTNVLTVQQAYRAVSWTTVVLVAGMMPLATAMQRSGAAERMANALVQSAGDAGPYALLAGLFLLTAALGQLISNTATALVVGPIAVSAAAGLGVSARPLLMAVTVAAAAAFLTPVATPVNLMVKEPGGYYFGDYWKLGLPLLLWFFCVTLALVPIFWPF